MTARLSYLCDCCRTLNSDALKAELEAKTGKMVTFRNKDVYRAGQAKAQRERRKRLKAESNHPVAEKG